MENFSPCFSAVLETSHIPTAAILLDGGKSDTLAVDACAGRDAVLVKGFIQIGISDFAKPVVCMRGKPGKFLVFQDQFLFYVRCIFGRG